MKRVDVRFYAELNDFLPLWKRKRTTTCYFEVSGSIKDMTEALGVPHTEVDLILANGESVDFSYRVQDGDKISVYPVFESIDIPSLVRLRPVPLREVRFIADATSAGWRRICGWWASIRCIRTIIKTRSWPESPPAKGEHS